MGAKDPPKGKENEAIWIKKEIEEPGNSFQEVCRLSSVCVCVFIHFSLIRFLRNKKKIKIF